MTSAQLTLGDFAPPMDPELSQYHTPVPLARRMVEWAGVMAGMRVLEPSAGGGNIVRELAAAGAKVTAVELDRNWIHLLTREFYMHGAIDDLRMFDFLLLTDLGELDLAVMNPPLNDGVGAEHVAHALECAPRAVSLLRAQDLHGQERYERLWSKCDLARVAHLVRRPIFSGSGGATEFVVVDVHRAGTYAGPQTIEHWNI